MRVGTQKENALSLWDISVGHRSAWRMKVSRILHGASFQCQEVYSPPLKLLFFFFHLEDNCVIQCCDGFFPISTWISHRHMYALPLEPPSNLPPHPPPLGCHRAPVLGSLHHTANFHWLSLLHLVMFMFRCICFNATLSNHPTFSFPHCDHNSVLYVSDVSDYLLNVFATVYLKFWMFCVSSAISYLADDESVALFG